MTPRFVFGFLTLALALMPSSLLGGEPAAAPDTKEKQARRDRYGDPLPEGAIARLGTTRLRVDQHVRAFAFWPDDKTLAACCADGSVRFWERATGREIRRLQTPLSEIRAAVFVPKTKAVALLGKENQFILWDSAAGKTVWKISLPDYDRREGCLAVSPDGKLLAVPEQKKVDLYDAASGRKIRSLEEIGGSTLVFSPDSTLLAIAASEPPAHLWDIRSGKKIRDLPYPENFLSDGAIAFSHDGKMVAVGSCYRAIVSKVASGKEISRLQFDDLIICKGFLFTADGKTLISGHYPGSVRSWNPATGKERYSRRLHWEVGAWPVLSHDGKVLAVLEDRFAPGCRAIRLLDPATGKDMEPRADGHEYELDFIAFSADGKAVFSGDRGTVREWKKATGEPIRLIRGGYFGTDTALSADRKLLAKADINRIALWDPKREKPIRTLEYKGKDLIRFVAFSPDGKYLYSAHNKCSPPSRSGEFEGQDGLHCWNLATGKEIHHSSTLATDLYSQLLITPDGRTAIAGSVKGRVRFGEDFSSTSTSGKGAGQLYLWDLPNGRVMRTLEGHRGAIRSLALSGDGRLLASASADHTVRLWELISGKTLFVLPADKTDRPVTTLSPDGRLVAIGTESTLRLYSTATGKAVLELRGYNSEVRCVAFSPDNQRLATGLSDGTGLVWDVSAACRAVRPEARRLSAKKRETLWTGLADADAISAQRAVGTLIAGGNDAVEMLKERLRPVERVEPKRLEKLLADLDSDVFAVREAATQELMNLGERADAALDAALKNRPSLEARKRIDDLLVRSRSRELSAEGLRAMRAVRVLEQIGSDEARALLRHIATGIDDALLTVEVKTSLARLAQRPARTP